MTHTISLEILWLKNLTWLFLISVRGGGIIRNNKKSNKYLNTYIIHAKDIVRLRGPVATISKQLSNQLLLYIRIAHTVVQANFLAHLDCCKKALHRSIYIHFGSLTAVRRFNKNLSMPHTFSAHQIHHYPLVSALKPLMASHCT